MSAASLELFRRAGHAQVVEAKFIRRIYWHTPGPTIQPPDLLLPEYWSRFTQLLRQNDRVECCPADSSWFVELVVRGVGAEGVVMMKLRGGALDGVGTPPGASRAMDLEASVEYGGPLLLWQVHGIDGRVLKSGLQTQEQAMAWLAEHRKMQQATSGRDRQ